MNDDILKEENYDKDKFIIEIKDSTNTIRKIEIVKLLPSSKELKLYAIYKIIENDNQNENTVTLNVAIWDENDSGIKLKEIKDNNEYQYALTLLNEYTSKKED